MKKIIFLFVVLMSNVILFAQDCDLRLQTARSYKNQGEYKQAVSWYKKVLADCGDYDGKVKTELQECQRKSRPERSTSDYVPVEQPGLRLNDTQIFFEAEGGNDAHIYVTCEGQWVVNVTKGKDWLDPGKNGDLLVVDCLPNNKPEPRDGVLYIIAGEGTIVAKVTVRQEEGDGSSNYAPTTGADLLTSVKVSFEAGKDTPLYENVMNLIAVLANNNNLGLKIDVPWCRSKYDIELIEKRIQNITNYFMSMGLNKDRISQNISMNGDKDCDEAYLRVVSVSDNNTLTTVSSGAQRNSTMDQEDDIEPGKKKLAPKDKTNLKELSDVLSNTKITFDKDSDIPKINDENDNINRTVAILKANPTFGLQIEGYADNTGSEEHQRDLAQRRAYNVMQIFIDKGVPANQITTVTYTVNDPRFNQNIPDDGRNENNRAIFRLLVN